jgi:hypothetical protein
MSSRSRLCGSTCRCIHCLNGADKLVLFLFNSVGGNPPIGQYVPSDFDEIIHVQQ